MAISSRPFVDRSPWVYMHVAQDARRAFDDPSKAGECVTPLLNLYRLLDRFKHDAFTVSYPPGVLKGSANSPTEVDRPRHLKLAALEDALRSAFSSVYAGQKVEEVVPILQQLISELVEEKTVARADKRLRQGSKFLERLASQLHA